MDARQLNVSRPRAGRIPEAVHEPLYWGGLSCFRHSASDKAEDCILLVRSGLAFAALLACRCEKRGALSCLRRDGGSL